MAKSESQSKSHRTTLISRKLAIPFEALLVLAGGVGVAVSGPNLSVWLLLAWAVAALVYLVVAGFRLLQAVRSSEQNQILLPGDSPHRGTWGKSFHLDVFVIGAASTLGVVSAIIVTRNADLTDFAVFSRMLAAASLILAWLLLQIGFSRLYADTWHKGEGEPGLDFPKMEEPGLVEFTYHAFAVGAGFKTSDVEVTTSHMRALVTIHSVTSFLYNAVLVAYVVSIMASA